jgi:hypothetical protein
LVTGFALLKGFVAIAAFFFFRAITGKIWVRVMVTVRVSVKVRTRVMVRVSIMKEKRKEREEKIRVTNL